MIKRFVILGAAGDLTRRYLMPALAQLMDGGRLPVDIEITGGALQASTTEEFRTRIDAALGAHAGRVDAAVRERLVSRLAYIKADVTSAEELSALDLASIPAVIYLALPPPLFIPAIRALAQAGMTPECRIVVEKPFGADLASARSLNQVLHTVLPEAHVFRVDHFLGMQTVQNFLGLRFANRIFEPVWNAQHIERVEVRWDETLGLEGRASYYDGAGALRDMVQNHLLQLLALIALEPPVRLTEAELRNRKVEVLRSVRRLSPAEVRQLTVRGRYGAGRIGDRQLPAYVDEEGIDGARGTETFAQVTLFVDNWRWAGVPFVLRTGKALGQMRKQVAIHFRPVPHSIFEETPTPNVLRFALRPDHVRLGLNLNGAGDFLDLERVDLEEALEEQDLSAYARLLLDVLEGDPMLSIRDDEAEESWKIVEPVLHAWSAGAVPLQEYPAGSEGPLPA